MTHGKGEMSAKCPTCDEPGLLLWYAAGTLGADETTLVRRSLEECAVCRQLTGENQHLARAVRLARPPLEERAPAELVALASGPREGVEAAGLSEADRALVALLRRVDEVSEPDTETGWGAELRRGWDSLFERGSWGWVRSPAVAYLLLLVVAYPAYLGVTASGRTGTPRVLDAPSSVDTGARAGGEAVVSVGEAGTSVLTVFVPIDEQYRYRLEVLDERGVVQFVDDDVRSFDGVGTLAIFVPEGFLVPGSYEVRVTELARGDGAPTEPQVFRFPFRLQ